MACGRPARAAGRPLLRDNGGVSQANDKVAALIEEYADLYVMTGGDPFRARVYSKAARALAAQTQDVTALSGPALLRIPGVGKSIAAKVGEISTTGTFGELEELRADIPDGVRQLTRIPALGPRRALQLYHELAISSPDQLRDAIAAGQLNDLKGFGPKSTEKLLRGLDLLATAGGRVLLNVAAETAAERHRGCQRGWRLSADRAGRIAAAGQGEHRRRRRAGGRRRLGPANGSAHRHARRSRGHRGRPGEDVDPDGGRAAGGPARGRA